MNLSKHTLRFYDQQLDHLMELILEMGLQVRELTLAAKRSLRERQDSLVEFARAADKKINQLDLQIEEEATAILALQSPVAIDLRFVTSALKISGMLERAGDLAKNIVKRSVRLGEYSSEKTLEKLEAMADISAHMLHEALLAVQMGDSARAITVWKQDDEVDSLYHQVFLIMQHEMIENPDNVPSCTHMVFAAKNFERIGDYATNLAKTVYYVTSGKRADKTIIHEEMAAKPEA